MQPLTAVALAAVLLLQIQVADAEGRPVAKVVTPSPLRKREQKAVPSPERPKVRPPSPLPPAPKVPEKTPDANPDDADHDHDEDDSPEPEAANDRSAASEDVKKAVYVVDGSTNSGSDSTAKSGSSEIKEPAKPPAARQRADELTSEKAKPAKSPVAKSTTSSETKVDTNTKTTTGDVKTPAPPLASKSPVARRPGKSPITEVEKKKSPAPVEAKPKPADTTDSKGSDHTGDTKKPEDEAEVEWHSPTVDDEQAEEAGAQHVGDQASDVHPYQMPETAAASEVATTADSNNTVWIVVGVVVPVCAIAATVALWVHKSFQKRAMIETTFDCEINQDQAARFDISVPVPSVAGPVETVV